MFKDKIKLSHEYWSIGDRRQKKINLVAENHKRYLRFELNDQYFNFTLNFPLKIII